MAISLVDDMDKLVKPEMRNSWYREKPKVFVVDEKNAEVVVVVGVVEILL